MERTEEKWVCGRKIKDQIWDIFCFGCLRDITVEDVPRAVEYMDLELRREVWAGVRKWLGNGSVLRGKYKPDG